MIFRQLQSTDSENDDRPSLSVKTAQDQKSGEEAKSVVEAKTNLHQLGLRVNFSCSDATASLLMLLPYPISSDVFSNKFW